MDYQQFIMKLANPRKTVARKGVVESHRANCPACHGSRQPLSAALTADGVILLNCFAGCNAYSITAALGVEIDDLFPKLDQRHGQAPRFQSQTEWMSVSGLADAVCWAAAIAANQPTQENLAAVVEYAAALQRAARSAMKKEAR